MATIENKNQRQIRTLPLILSQRTVISMNPMTCEKCQGLLFGDKYEESGIYDHEASDDAERIVTSVKLDIRLGTGQRHDVSQIRAGRTRLVSHR